jgi:hypothetical protein
MQNLSSGKLSFRSWQRQSGRIATPCRGRPTGSMVVAFFFVFSTLLWDGPERHEELF